MSSYSLAGMPLLDYLLPFLSRLQVWLFHPCHDEYLSRISSSSYKWKDTERKRKANLQINPLNNKDDKNPSHFALGCLYCLNEKASHSCFFFFRLDLEGRKKKKRSWKNLGSLWTQTKLHFIVVRIFLAPLGFVFCWLSGSSLFYYSSRIRNK